MISGRGGCQEAIHKEGKQGEMGNGSDAVMNPNVMFLVQIITEATREEQQCLQPVKQEALPLFASQPAELILQKLMEKLEKCGPADVSVGSSRQLT